MTEMATSAMERRTFQTETKQLLNLVINSLYTHKEVFLRELISNASDALDKLRFAALTDKTLLKADTELCIKIKLDKNAKTITVSDNGIGMNRQEVIDNIGTIARSGSKAFLEKLTGDQKADSNLIGQFGVGFYSVFMVASRVKIITKKAGGQDPAVVWESDGILEFTIGETEKQDVGTDVVVYLRDDETVYSEDWKVRSIIKKYSDFIAFPIYLPNEKGRDEVINETKPLWKRVPSEISQQQYADFYQQVLGGFDKPLAVIHSQAEGRLEYSYLLFIGSRTPFELFELERKHGIKLYVKRVFVMDNCSELLPEYLRFVKGVVDSEDLPLNVSREMLQQNPIIERIRKNLVSKLLGKLKEMADTEPQQYLKFWQQCGAVLKEGLHTDYENKDKLLELVRFQSSFGASKDDLVSLKQYVSRMKPEQLDIYYICGESREIVEKSPHLEFFREKNIEVLYMLDPIDEFIVNDIYNFEGKMLKSVTKGELELGELDKQQQEEKKKVESKYKKLLERMKNILSDSVKEVRTTARLKGSPCCLVTDEHGIGAHMEKIMKAMGQSVPQSKPTLEVNVEHPIIENLNAIYEKSPKDPQLEEWVKLLFDQATIAQGQMVKDPMAYSKRVNDLLLKVSAESAKFSGL